MRKRADQWMRVRADAPLVRRVRELDPVELDLLARRMRDRRPVPALRRVAGLAVRPDPVTTKRLGERRVGAPVAELAHLVEQSGRPQVGVIGQSLLAVPQERHEWVWALTALVRRSLAARIGADRLAVTTQMPGDRRDRPALATQRVRVPVFLHRAVPACPP
jgi:hypothetical protein